MGSLSWPQRDQPCDTQTSGHGSGPGKDQVSVVGAHSSGLCYISPGHEHARDFDRQAPPSHLLTEHELRARLSEGLVKAITGDMRSGHRAALSEHRVGLGRAAASYVHPGWGVLGPPLAPPFLKHQRSWVY